MIEFLEIEQVQKMFLVYKDDPEKRLLLRFLYFTGCRISEALALTPHRVFPERRGVQLPALKLRKKEDKWVVLDEETLTLLTLFIKARRIGVDKPVFSMNRKQAWTIAKTAGEAIGIKGMHPHLLRHSFASHWAAAGGDMVKLSRQLGHKRLSTTMDMYIHCSSKGVQEDYDKIFNKDGWINGGA